MNEQLSLGEIEKQRVEHAIVTILAAHEVRGMISGVIGLSIEQLTDLLETRDQSLKFMRNRAIQQTLIIARNQLYKKLIENKLSTDEIEVINHYLYTWLDTRADVNFGPSSQLKLYHNDTSVLRNYIKTNWSLSLLPDFVDDSRLLRSPYSDFHAKERVGVKALISDLKEQMDRVFVPSISAALLLPFKNVRADKVREFFEALVGTIKEIFITDLIALTKQIDADFDFTPELLSTVYLKEGVFKELSQNIELRTKNFIHSLAKAMGKDWETVYEVMEDDYSIYQQSSKGMSKLKVEGEFFKWLYTKNRPVYEKIKTLRTNDIFKVSFYQVLIFLEDYHGEDDDEVIDKPVESQLSKEKKALDRMYQLDMWKTYREDMIEFIGDEDLRELAGEDINFDKLYDACLLHDDLSALFISIDEDLFKLNFDNLGRVTLSKQDLDDFDTTDNMGIYTIKRIKEFFLAIKELDSNQTDEYWDILRDLKIDKLSA